MSIRTTQDVEVTYGAQLAAVEVLPDFCIRLKYRDGAEYIYDFKPTIAAGGLMALLADPEVFQQAYAAHGGTAVAFTDELEFCADGLRYEAELQKRGLPIPD
jgi:hypothetical protein